MTETTSEGFVPARQVVVARPSPKPGAGRRAARAVIPGPTATILDTDRSGRKIAGFLMRHPRIAVLTGAGVSTGSGIPDYRDDDGNWKHPRPVQYAEFLARADVRRRYWARSCFGWQRVARAAPNAAHAAITRLERAGRLAGVITQNVDGLHQRAGTHNVLDLHGTLTRVRCLGCGAITPRAAFQAALEQDNPGFSAAVGRVGPDGDSVMAADDPTRFSVPACDACGGILRPDVVFFGEAVPALRVVRAGEIVTGADALLVVGSSLMVFSGYRFARMAHAAGLPIAIVNRGITRADPLATFRAACDCARVLSDGAAAVGA